MELARNKSAILRPDGFSVIPIQVLRVLRNDGKIRYFLSRANVDLRYIIKYHLCNSQREVV